MIRVLHILPDLVPYGLERMVATLATLRSREKYAVSVASLYPELPGSLAQPLVREGVEVFHLDKQRGFDGRMFHRIWGVLRKVRPDVVHTHNYVLRYVYPASLLDRPPVIVHTIHNVADREVDHVGRILQRYTFRRRVQPVVIAEEGAASFDRVYGLPRPPLIRNGIAVAHYASASAQREQWRIANGFSPADLLFLCVARYDAQKNHKTLIEAFAAGPARLPHATLLLAGEGQLRPELEALVRALGVDGKVRFLGRRDDVPQLLAAADVFVLASLWEGNPLSVMEAMAAGLPSVVTAVGGVPELVAHGQEGLVVPAGDVRAFCEASLQLGTDAAMRRRLGHAAAQRARTEFDDRNMVKAYESLYDELLSVATRDRGSFVSAGKRFTRRDRAA